MQIFSQTNIYDISRSGDLEALKDIYKHTPELINQTNDKGYSPCFSNIPWSCRGS